MSPFDVTAARAEIQVRNELRREMHMPLVDEDAELAKTAKVHLQREFDAEFGRYLEQHRALYRRAMRRGLDRLRREFDAPVGWTPKSWEGMSVQSCIRQAFRRRFEQQRSAG